MGGDEFLHFLLAPLELLVGGEENNVRIMVRIKFDCSELNISQAHTLTH